MRRSTAARSASLRSILTIVMATLAVLALGAAATLIVLTTFLHREAESLGDSMDDIRLAQELQVALLRYSRVVNIVGPTLDGLRTSNRVDMERLASEKFRDIQRQAPSANERLLVVGAERTIQTYLSTGGNLAQALESLDRLVAFEVDEGQAVTARVAQWERFADIAGSTMAILLLLGVTATLIWLRTSALNPVLGIRGAIQRLTQGDGSAHAPVEGPMELREIALAFNDMAEHPARNREGRLTFLAGVAHDLRNPLSPLMAASALLLDRDGAPPPELLRKTLSIISRQVGRLDRMIGDLLDATRIEAGQLELRLAPTDIRDVVTSVAELYRHQGTTHEIEVILPDRPLCITCDRLRIEQVLTNLLSNAIKYSLESTPIRIEARDGDRAVTIEVADRGIGISEADLPTIFEPFRRVGRSRDSVPGSGLGLSVARRLIEAHHGRIWASGRPRGGSIFTVMVPHSAGDFSSATATARTDENVTPAVV